jgi:hypothetical protein
MYHGPPVELNLIALSQIPADLRKQFVSAGVLASTFLEE